MDSKVSTPAYKPGDRVVIVESALTISESNWLAQQYGTHNFEVLPHGTDRVSPDLYELRAPNGAIVLNRTNDKPREFRAHELALET